MTKNKIPKNVPLRIRYWDEENQVMHYYNKIKIMDNGIFFTGSNKHNDSINKKNISYAIGVKDSNKKDIYTGDIIACGTETSWENGKEVTKDILEKVELDMAAVAVFNHGHFGLASMFKNGCTEIVGNIYENPELIK